MTGKRRRCARPGLALATPLPASLPIWRSCPRSGEADRATTVAGDRPQSLMFRRLRLSRAAGLLVSQLVTFIRYPEIQDVPCLAPARRSRNFVLSHVMDSR